MNTTSNAVGLALLLTIKDYERGYMMYLHQPSLEALSNDIVAFFGGK